MGDREVGDGWSREEAARKGGKGGKVAEVKGRGIGKAMVERGPTVVERSGDGVEGEVVEVSDKGWEIGKVRNGMGADGG